MPMTFSSDSAETLALQALAWLVAQEDLLGLFMGSTGASETDLREAVDNPGFLGSVLDFLMQDDAWIVAFCDAGGLGYDQPAQARAALPGGAQVHWT